MQEVWLKLNEICHRESYKAHRVDNGSILKLWDISNSIESNNIKWFEYLLEQDRLERDRVRLVNSYKVPLLKRVISERPDFLEPLLESSSEVKDYYLRHKNALDQLDTSGSLASGPKEITPIDRLITAIEEDDVKTVAMVLPATNLKQEGSINFLRKLATKHKSDKVLPHLLNYTAVENNVAGQEDNSLQENTKKVPMVDLTKGLEQTPKNLKGVKGVKNRLSAPKYSLGGFRSRLGAAITRVRAATRRSKKSASSSSSKNHRSGNNRS